MIESEGSRIFVYHTDAQDRLSHVDQAWLDFAQENQAPELTAVAVLGQPLERFIAGWEVRHLYTLLFEKVRRDGQAVQFPFRCDSPDSARYFRMQVAPLVGGGLEFTASVLRIEPRPLRPILDRARDRSSLVVVICSWCKRILDDDHWVEIESALQQRKLFAAAPPALTHGVCPDCLSTIQS